MENIDQLSSLLAPILNDPEAMAGIAEAAAQLGLGDMLGGLSGQSSSSSDTVQQPDTAAAFQQEAQSAAASADHDSPGGIGALGGIGEILGKVMPLLSSTGNTEHSARLLAALRPFLHGDRAKRLDDVERMIKLLGVVSALRQQGIL